MPTATPSPLLTAPPGPFRGLRLLRAHAIRRLHCPSDVHFAMGVSAVWLLLYNVRFWLDTFDAMWHGNLRSGVFLLSLLVLVLCLQALLLLILPTRRLMVTAAGLLFMVAAATSYFTARYGVLMNKDMLRNVFETNGAEAWGLMTPALCLRFAVMGIVPVLIVWRVRFPATAWTRRLRVRLLAIAALLLTCAAALLSSSASYAVFFREHKPLRYALSPAAPLSSAVGLVLDEQKHRSGPLINASGLAQRTAAPNAKPLMVVLVIGETARAQNFQLGGYARPTNPELSKTAGLIYFSNTRSCATATAMSVPCLFSHLPRSDFDVNAAPRYANLLDALQDAGLDVQWRDNDSGCKGVCARVQQVNYSTDADPRFCNADGCDDAVLTQDLPARLRDLRRDSVIVMHQLGSHGPAYSKRYPAGHELFKPACHSNELQRCSTQEIVNAYDNTIAYTDHVLARTIRMLREADDMVDSVLLYVSDHGESLGEQGLYLHGLPYSFAPETQTHVPMLMWLSPGYVSRSGVDMTCLQSRAARAFSHDNFYHTVLAAAEVRNDSYDAGLDLLDSCRAKGGTDHE